MPSSGGLKEETEGQLGRTDGRTWGRRMSPVWSPAEGQVLLGLRTDCRYQVGSPLSDTVGPEKPLRSMAVEEAETTCVAMGQGRGSAVGGSCGNSAIIWGGSELDCD